MNRKQRRAMGKNQPPPAKQAADRTDPLELHARGLESFQAGRAGVAAELIAQAIAAGGATPDIHYNLAIVLKSLGRLPEAAASYERAIALKPDYADAHNNLGNIRKELGESAKARASFERALQIKPGNADSHYNLGILCSQAGERDEAARHFRQCLAHDPDDSRGIAILLAQMGNGEVPARTSAAQMQKIYDVRARFWDQEGTYFGHVLVAQAFHDHAVGTSLDILDIGCGTGLVGEQVRGLARQLDGVDLSAAMLEKARAKEIYDRLEQADLLSFLTAHPGRYDAILGAATLIHFGNLSPLFQAVAQSLRPQGLFVFTLFPNEADGAGFAVAASDRLAQSGCFRHGAGYVERLAADNGFAVAALRTVLHEHDQDGNPVPGLLAVLRRE
jgi:predicted TPR repeat methyltransferase